MKFKNIMKHALGRVPTISRPRSSFDRTCRYTTTADAGYIFPIFCREVYPGTTTEIDVHSVARMTTLTVPFMNNVYLDLHTFYCPSRLLWDNFQKFMGARENPDDSNDYLVPKITLPAGGAPAGTLANYFGFNTMHGGQQVNALPFRAYNLIYNEWFRHNKLIDSIPVQTGDSGDVYTDYILRRRCKRSDYFTSCLPSPQQGPSVDVPLLGSAPVVGTGIALGLTNGSSNFGLRSNTSGNPYLVASSGAFNSSTGSYLPGTDVVTGSNSMSVVSDPSTSGLVADLTNVSAATVNMWRQAFQMQKVGEALMRGGDRFTEILQYIWGVKSPDSRLQRPEFLGSHSHFINVNQVAQTSSTDTSSPQGNLSAYSYGLYPSQRTIKKSFVEHGYVMILASIRSDLQYQQGIHREWTRSTMHDFLMPQYVHLGEQAVLNKEIYADGTQADNEVFGYMPRYDELRYGYSQITGKLNSTDPQSLDYWHIAQNFQNRPLLNQTFIEENPAIERVVAVQDEPHFFLDFAIKEIWTGQLPVYSQPGYIDHF